MTELYLTFEGPRIGKQGVPIAALVSALQGIQGAVLLMVEHLADYQRKRGRPLKWIKDQSALQLSDTRPGSFVAKLTLDPATVDSGTSKGYGERALDAFHRWDGGYDSTLPETVVDRLWKMSSKLPEGVRVWLGDAEAPRRVVIASGDGFSEHVVYPAPKAEEALVYGRLKMVNWDKRTAQLHRYGGRYVPLRFEASLDDEMRRLANQFVEVKGEGRFNLNDEWQSIRVEEITATRSRSEPFDMEAFLGNPNPKVFDPETVVTASEPFDVDEFIRVIREGRDVGQEEPSG